MYVCMSVFVCVCVCLYISYISSSFLGKKNLQILFLSFQKDFFTLFRMPSHNWSWMLKFDDIISIKIAHKEE